MKLTNLPKWALSALHTREERAGLDGKNFKSGCENGYDHHGDMHDDRRRNDAKRRTGDGP